MLLFSLLLPDKGKLKYLKNKTVSLRDPYYVTSTRTPVIRGGALSLPGGTPNVARADPNLAGGAPILTDVPAPILGYPLKGPETCDWGTTWKRHGTSHWDTSC